MVSSSRQNHLRRAANIVRNGHSAAISCDRCHHSGTACFILSTTSGDSKCAECTRRGRCCVRTSWAALDASRDKLSDGIAADEKRREQLIAELVELQAQIEQKRRVRAQAERQAQEMMQCVVQETQPSSDALWSDKVDFPSLDLDELELPTPFAWDSIDSLPVTAED